MRRFKNCFVAFVGALVLFCVAAPFAGTQKYSDWSAPVNLGTVINSSSDDFGPAISKDGLTLYFNSFRPGGFGESDIYVAQRVSRDLPWDPPLNLGPVINTDSFELNPALSRDEHYLFFVSPRAGSGDIWVSYRKNVHDDFAWESPVMLGPPVNTAAIDTTPSYFENEEHGLPQLYFTSNRAGSNDIYFTEITTIGTFGPVFLVQELNSPESDFSPEIRRNGLEIFFQSNRPGSAGVDLWVSSRRSVLDPWEPPVNLGPTVNSAFFDALPAISSDGEILLFASNRPGGLGLNDIYVTTRTKLHGDNE